MADKECKIDQCKSVFVTWMWLITIMSGLLSVGSVSGYAFGKWTANLEQKTIELRADLDAITEKIDRNNRELLRKLEMLDSISKKLDMINKRTMFYNDSTYIQYSRTE